VRALGHAGAAAGAPPGFRAQVCPRHVRPARPGACVWAGCAVLSGDSGLQYQAHACGGRGRQGPPKCC
jgi:hypothetical protein